MNEMKKIATYADLCIEITKLRDELKEKDERIRELEKLKFASCRIDGQYISKLEECKFSKELSELKKRNEELENELLKIKGDYHFEKGNNSLLNIKLSEARKEVYDEIEKKIDEESKPKYGKIIYTNDLNNFDYKSYLQGLSFSKQIISEIRGNEG